MLAIHGAGYGVAAAMAYGTAGHFDKPVSEQRLIATVRQHRHGGARIGSG